MSSSKEEIKEKSAEIDQGRDGSGGKSMKTVKMHSPSPQSSSTPSLASSTSTPPKWITSIIASFAWIKPNSTFPKWKPALRCALVAWVSAVLFVIPAVERQMGQAGFLILIAAFISPPSDPFIAVVEREFLIVFFVCLAWAWSAFGIFLANLTRHFHDPNVTFLEAATGRYVEAAPSVVMAVFVFIGTVFYLFVRARQGPGPYLFACVLGCLCMDLSLTTAALFPYPFYLIGRSVVIPLTLHTAICILGSIIVFPSSMSALFTTRLDAVLGSVTKMIETNGKLLASSPYDDPAASPESSQQDLIPYADLLSSARLSTRKAETSLVPLAAAAHLLPSDLIYGRFAPSDFKTFQGLCRRLVGRADGLGVFFGLVGVDKGSVKAAENSMPGTVPGTPRMPPSGPGTPGSHAPGAMTPTHPAPPNLRQHSHKDAHSQLHFSQSVAAGLQSSASSYWPTSGHVSGTATPVAASGSVQDQAHHHHGHHGHHHALHSSLLHLARSLSHQVIHPPHVKPREEWAVGTFESQRYLNLEQTRLYDPKEEEWTKVSFGVLEESCTPFLELCRLGLSTSQTWLTTVRSGRLKYFFNMKQDEALKQQKERREEIERVRDKVREGLNVFREVDRHLVLKPYRKAIEHNSYSASASVAVLPPSPLRDRMPVSSAGEGAPVIHSVLEEATDQLARKATVEDEKDIDDGLRDTHNKEKRGYADEMKEADSEYEMPPHRYLFNCYVYQYNLIQIGSIVIEMLDEILRLEEERKTPRLWTPVARVFRWNPWMIPENVEQLADDDDPDVIQGLRPEALEDATDTSSTLPGTSRYGMQRISDPAYDDDPERDLGLPRRRDPDALPPRNFVEWTFGAIYKVIVGLGGGNSVYAIKAGVLTVLLCLPSFIRSSAGFAYENRFVWGIFMGQLSIARFRGDTTFSLVARILATFFGGLTGMVMWYVSCGSAQGNAFGLAAVCFVCFPFFFFARLYCPVPPMMNIVFFVTSVLVIGYSYQDVHIVTPGAPGVGFPVFWKRVLLVTAGVFAAFIASFLPPSTTIRRYQRSLLATTSAEIGTIYCAILSFANTKHEQEIQDIISSLIAVRSKLSRSNGLRTNVGYEFSLRGKWPSERYQKIADLQMALAYSLSHLMSVLEHLEPSWSRAFLRRTRFMDPDFQGDILAVISMISSSLRTGCPLPQITPCPLLDRFTLKYHGLDVIHKDSEEDYGLPRTASMDTLKDEQYLMFCVGISIAYGIINRLDKLMLAVKEVVGEQYHIHGVGIVPCHSNHGFYSGDYRGSGSHEPAGQRMNDMPGTPIAT